MELVSFLLSLLGAEEPPDSSDPSAFFQDGSEYFRFLGVHENAWESWKQAAEDVKVVVGLILVHNA